MTHHETRDQSQDQAQDQVQSRAGNDSGATAPIRVLFICMGNICRSPTAEAVFRQLVHEQGRDDEFVIDSAGTHGYHVGCAPDARARAAASARGIDMQGIRSRRVTAADLAEFDYVLAMDNPNLEGLRALAPQPRARVARLLDYAPAGSPADVPDPYYGGDDGFEKVFDLVEAGCRGFLDAVRGD